MRFARPRLLLCLALPLAPIFAFAAACGSSDGGDANGNVDAGGGDSSPASPDSSTSDGGGPGTDGATDAATPGNDGGTDANATGAPKGIYVADTYNNRIVYFTDMTGAGWTTLPGADAGAEAGAPGSFLSPRDVFISASGKIYIVDDNDRIVRMDDITGAGWTTFGTTGTGTNQFGSPFGVAVDSMERIYIADLGNERIVRIDDMNGTGWTTWGFNSTDGGAFQFSAPERVSVPGTGGKIYVTDSSLARISRFDSNGTNWESFGIDGVKAGQYSDPFAITADNAGNVLIGDVGNIRITQVAFGADGGTQFNWTGGTVDGVCPSGGKIYFTDALKGQVVRIDDLSGANTVSFGSKGTGMNQFGGAQGIFVR
jgi:streptogramin lyase